MPEDQRPRLRVIHMTRLEPAPPSVRVQATPQAMERLHAVAADWLFANCSYAGREKLLREHQLLAA